MSLPMRDLVDTLLLMTTSSSSRTTDSVTLSTLNFNLGITHALAVLEKLKFFAVASRHAVPWVLGALEEISSSSSPPLLHASAKRIILTSGLLKQQTYHCQGSKER